MRKFTSLLGISLLALTGAACSAQTAQETAATSAVAAPAAAVTELKTQTEKVSYIFGLNIGRNLRQQGVEVDVAMVAKGMQDAAPGVKALMTDEEMQETMMTFQKELMAKQEARIKELSEKNKKAGAEFLAKNATEPGVKTTASGLQYKIAKEGDGATPKATDVVKAIYSGKLIDGTEFGSSDGEAVEIPLEHVFPGWAEGIQLLKVGGQATFWIPGELAYQDFAPPGIEPYSTLIMDVTLVDIVPQPPAEEEEAPEDATETAPAAPAAPEPAK